MTIEPVRKNRKWPWILALVLLFALGFWLGRLMAPKCPPCPAPPAAGAGGGGGGGGGGGSGHFRSAARGKGDPSAGGGRGGGGSGRVIGEGGRIEGSGGDGSAGSGQGTGDMAGGGKGGGDGTTVGHGYDGSATGSTGLDDGGGGTGGKPTPGDSPNGPAIDPAAKQLEAGVRRLAAGGLIATDGGDALQGNGKDDSVKVLSAHDFTYDKTGLPRYLDANKDVFSAMSYDVPGRTDTFGSAGGIVTGSGFDDVVNGYGKNLPGGWSASTVGDLNRIGAGAGLITRQDHANTRCCE